MRIPIKVIEAIETIANELHGDADIVPAVVGDVCVTLHAVARLARANNTMALEGLAQASLRCLATNPEAVQS